MQAEQHGHTYGTVQLRLPDAIVDTVRATAVSVLVNDIDPDKGFEACPHITVLYGIKSDTIDDVLAVVAAASGCLDAVVGSVRIFSPDDEAYDVVVHDIACPGIHALHDALCAKLDIAPAAYTYTPHLTLGYVRRGTGQHFAAAVTGLEGTVLHFDTVEFRRADDVAVTIPLDRGPAVDAGLVVALQAMALELPTVMDHPNRLPFRGILTRVDTPSDGSPGGANGHRVFLPAATAEAALPSLLGMGIGVHPLLNRHNPQRKIGVIMEATVTNGAVQVSGFLYARDFPEEVAAIQRLAKRGLLGMSFEVANVEIHDTHAEVWTILHCVFTGAAILERASAAYHTTSLAAAHEEEHRMDSEETADVTTTTVVAATTELAPTPLVTVSTLPFFTAPTDVHAGMESLMDTMSRMNGNVQHYASCMYAIDRLLGMRAGLESLTEALEHLVQMNEALHDARMQGGTAMEATETTSAAPAVVATTPAPPDQLAQLTTLVAAMAADIKLLTDNQTEFRGLLTDRGPGRPSGTRTLATDPGPQRRTIAANGDYAQYMSKYGMNAEQEYKEADVDTLLRNAGITDPAQRLAVKLEMQKQGQMVR